MKVGVLYARIRVEEKMVINELKARGVDYDLIDVRKISFDLEPTFPGVPKIGSKLIKPSCHSFKLSGSSNNSTTRGNDALISVWQVKFISLLFKGRYF